MLVRRDKESTKSETTPVTIPFAQMGGGWYNINYLQAVKLLPLWKPAPYLNFCWDLALVIAPLTAPPTDDGQKYVPMSA